MPTIVQHFLLEREVKNGNLYHKAMRFSKNLFHRYFDLKFKLEELETTKYKKCEHRKRLS